MGFSNRSRPERPARGQRPLSRRWLVSRLPPQSSHRRSRVSPRYPPCGPVKPPISRSPLSDLGGSGRSATMALSAPASALRRLDLPAFGASDDDFAPCANRAPGRERSKNSPKATAYASQSINYFVRRDHVYRLIREVYICFDKNPNLFDIPLKTLSPLKISPDNDLNADRAAAWV